MSARRLPTRTRSKAIPSDQLDSLRQLVADMNAGKVDTLLILGGNPVYSAPADLDFAGRSEEGRVESLSRALSRRDRPAVQLACARSALSGILGRCSRLRRNGQFRPAADRSAVRRQDGARSDLDAGRPARQVRPRHRAGLLAGADAKVPNFDIFWQKALHDGVVPNTALPAINVTAKMPPAPQPKARKGCEIMFRPDPTIWDGSFANNGWLQELPKPANKMTWDNAVWISPSTSQQKNLNTGDMVELKYQGRTVTGPVWIMPGHANDSATVHLGIRPHARRPRRQRSRIQRLPAPHLERALDAVPAWR